MEKYKQEVLEGLQIEEEGLTAFIRKKTKQASIFQNNYNDPFDNNNSNLDETISDNKKLQQKINLKSSNQNYQKKKNVTNSNTDEERIFKTQSNTKEIFEKLKNNYEQVEETTTQKIKLRHNRRDHTNKSNNNRQRNRGRKNRRRKNGRRNKKR